MACRNGSSSWRKGLSLLNTAAALNHRTKLHHRGVGPQWHPHLVCDSLDPSATIKPATSVLTSQLEGPKATALQTGMLKNTMPIEADTLDPCISQDPAEPPAQGSSSAQEGGSSEWSMGVEEDVQVQLARRFIYHVLLHLPVEVLRARQAFWMDHAVGLPDLMQICLGLALLQAPQVRG